MTKKAIILILGITCVGHALFGASDVSVKKGLSKGGRFGGVNPKVFTPLKPTAVAARGSIQSFLNLNKGVTLRTQSSAPGNGDLIIVDSISKKLGRRESKLSLTAARDVRVNAPLLCTKSTMPVSIVAGRGGSSSATGSITTNGGAITTDSVEPFLIGAEMNAGVGEVVVQTGTLGSATAQTIKASTVRVLQGGSLNLQGTVAGNVVVAGRIAP